MPRQFGMSRWSLGYLSMPRLDGDLQGTRLAITVNTMPPSDDSRRRKKVRGAPWATELLSLAPGMRVNEERTIEKSYPIRSSREKAVDLVHSSTDLWLTAAWSLQMSLALRLNRLRQVSLIILVLNSSKASNRSCLAGSATVIGQKHMRAATTSTMACPARSSPLPTPSSSSSSTGCPSVTSSGSSSMSSFGLSSSPSSSLTV